MLTILDSILNINWGNMYDHLTSTRIVTLIMNEACIRAATTMTQMAVDILWDLPVNSH